MWFDATRNSVDMMMDVSQEKKKNLITDQGHT